MADVKNDALQKAKKIVLPLARPKADTTYDYEQSDDLSLSNHKNTSIAGLIKGQNITSSMTNQTQVTQDDSQNHMKLMYLQLVSL